MLLFTLGNSLMQRTRVSLPQLPQPLLLLQLLSLLLLATSAELPNSSATELLAVAAARPTPSPASPLSTWRSTSDHMRQMYRLMRDQPDIWLGPEDGVPEIRGAVSSVVSHGLIGTPRPDLATFNASSLLDAAEQPEAVHLRLHRRGLELHRRGRSLLAHRVSAHLCDRPAGVGLLPAGASELAMQLDRHEFESCRRADHGRIAVRLSVRPASPATEGTWTPATSVHSRRRRDVAEPPQLVTYHRSRQRREVRHSAQRRRRRDGGGGGRRRRRYSSGTSGQQLPHVASDLAAVCQRRPLYVDFAEIGWDSWIIAPQGFDAGACSGQCPFPLSDVFNATNHAILQMTLHSSRPGQASPPTCVPAKLRPKTILYQGSHNEVVLKSFDDMEVDYCGCR
ncbi:hypothetical protein BOX15_Mlig030963g3 [Macrostomum lignano]|uniref:TGF-beta family profile domain-containing protein n=1 Tax=Macrostomum lignano TaxID=282301 RepID=A0A267GBL0_9PLAT|nr:hypothetical protein BOX15_Mlig030963g3 [Macrostomum lignano]